MTKISRVDEPNLFDERGMASTLRVTLVALLSSALAISALTLLLRWRHAPQLALMSAASCLVALVWSRFGRIRSAMLFPLLSITYAIVHLAARSDGIQNIGLAILPVLIMLGSLILDRLALVFFTAAEILAIVGMLAIRYFVLQAERYSTNDMGDLFIFALTCATAALVGRLLAVRIEDGFRLVRDSESRYRRIFENVQDVYYEMSVDGILLELNPASAALFGIPREGMIGRPLAQFCENTSEFDALRAAVRARGQVSNRELVIRDSGAVLRHVLVNASLQTVPGTGEERVIGSIRDITERKRAQEALRESDRTFRELLQAMQFVAVVTAPNGKIIFCNDYALAITGWSKEEVIGRAAQELLAPESLLQVADEKAIAPQAGGTRPFIEGSILQNDGGRRWIQWSSTPLRDLAGRVAGLASLGEDVTELRALRVEAARLESEARFRDLADTAPVMIWVSGPDKLCTFFNKPWLDFTGRTMTQEIGNGWASGVHPDDFDRCLAIYSSSFDARRKFQMEYRLRRADGEYRWLVDNGTPLYRDAEFAGFIGSCIDITERRQAEEALRENEQRLVSIYNTVGDVIFQLAVEPEGRFRFVSVNTAFLRVTGLSLEAVVGKTVNEVIPEPSLTTVLEKYRLAVRENTIVRWEETSDYPTGRLVGEVSVAPLFNDNGTCTHLVGSVHDISERKRAEDAVRESEERFRVLFSQAAVGITQTSVDGVLLVVNDRACEMLGYTETELRHKPFLEVTHRDDLERSGEAMRRMLSGEIPSWQTEKRYIHKDGSIVWARVSVSLVRDQNNLPQYFVCVAEDVTDRVRADRARQDSERRLTLAESAAHVGVWECDLRTKVITNSAEFAKLRGIAPDARPLWYQEWLEFVHSDDRERVMALMRESIQKQQGWDTEFRVVWPDGSVHWLLSKGTVFAGDSGEAVGLAGVNLDITERKEAEAALRESEERFRAIFQQAAVGVAQLTLEGKVEFANDCYSRIIGDTEKNLPGAGNVASTHRDDLRTQTEMLRRLLTGELPSFSMEKRYERMDGTVVWARICKSLARDPDNRPKHIIAIVEDITERKQAEAALIESEERFRNMADSAPVMIWMSGPDKLCTFFNRGWLTFTGSTMDQSVGNGWNEKLHPDDRSRCYTNYSSAFDARRTYQSECRLRRADGDYRWVLVTGTPRFESSGAFAGYVGSCTDTTDIKRTQEEALAGQKLESLGVLAGGVAHDFNNLLGSIVATSELVLSELPDGSPASEGVESIRTVAGRAAEIVGQMMAYAGQEDAVFEPVDLSGLLHEMLEFLKVSISKRTTLNVTLPEKLPFVRANAAQLRQVVLNLITNASEALGGQEGVISVTVSRVQSGASDGVPNLPRGDYVGLEVSDTGCGMTEEIQSKIFDPFFTTKFPGRGMGLAAVKGIVRSHEGAINVVSAPGQGSRFEILLPCGSQSTREGHEGAASAAGEAANFTGTVLVVEDEDTLRIAVSKMLKRRGLTVIEAANGKVGVDLFRAGQAEIDVVLLDLTLPGMSGREVLSELRRVQPNVKVIITSAYSQEQAETTLGGQHPWLYIRKPYQLKELTGLLRKSI